MNTNDTAEKQRILYKDNVLVKTKYELSLVENKLYNLLLYKFQKEGNLLKCKITHSEIKEVIKNKETNTISGIHTVLSKLSSKKILIEEVKPNNKNSLWHNYNLINGYTYDDEFKDFEIQATEKIYALLKQKFENGCYTPNNLNVFLNLNNYYAQRLYELLRLWSNTKSTVTYRIDELKDYFMLSNNYKEYGNFKRRIILPAIKELNKNGLFEITIKENKCGRKVESIDFIIKDLDKRKYFASQPSIQNNLNKNELALDISYENMSNEVVNVESPAIDAISEVPMASITVEEDINNIETISNMPLYNTNMNEYEMLQSNNYIETPNYKMNTYDSNIQSFNHNEAIENYNLKQTHIARKTSINTGIHNIKNLVESISTVYPEETILNKACLRLLKIDFKGYDFSEGDLYMAYAEAEAMTMEKDNVEIIGVGSYQYFKAVLKSKIDSIR